MSTHISPVKPVQLHSAALGRKELNISKSTSAPRHSPTEPGTEHIYHHSPANSLYYMYIFTSHPHYTIKILLAEFLICFSSFWESNCVVYVNLISIKEYLTVCEGQELKRCQKYTPKQLSVSN